MRQNNAMQRTYLPSTPQRYLGLLAVLVTTVSLSACDLLRPPSVPEVSQADESSRRVLQTGEIIGFENAAGGHTWLGIPYAAPPVGSLRWRAPRVPAPWSQPRESLRAGSPCIQYGSPLGGVGRAGEPQGSEDCLFLNVYAPASAQTLGTSSSLPVMVFVHGGGNTIGHAAFYDGSVLAQQENVLVVMINYRLGPLGWFLPPPGASPAPLTVDNVTTADSNVFSADPNVLASLDQSGNYGILDVIAALHWVQRNARAFGGDPDRVTVFGESAGGTNVLALLVSPWAEGLFHRAIIQSLGFGFSAIPNDRSPYSTTNILARLNLDTQQRPEALAETLRALDPWTIYAAFDRSSNEWERLPTVFQEGVVVPKEPTLSLLADPSKHHDVPLIVGTNRDEAKIFMAFDPRHTRRFAGLPYSLKNPLAYELESRYRARLWAADGVDTLASVMATGEPVYAYRWDWDEQGKAFGLIDLSQLLGAAHALEVPFVTGHFEVGNQTQLLFHQANAQGRLQLAAQMMGYWAQFARDGKPGRAGGVVGAIDWPAWPVTGDGALRLVLDTLDGGGLTISDELLSKNQVAREIFEEGISVEQRCELFRATFRNAHDPEADTLWAALSDRQCEGPRWLAPDTPPRRSRP
jgi:para-nitrobenzyl esterase